MPTRIDWPEAEARAALAEFESAIRRLARGLARSASRCDAALDADDLASEGRIAVLEALSAYGGEGGVSRGAWVRTRAKQRMLDAIRRTSVYTRNETATRKRDDDDLHRMLFVGYRGGWLPDSRPLADDVLAAKQDMQKAYLATAALTPRRLEALEGGLAGEPLLVTGARMGITGGRVCQLQHEAAARLRATLAADSMPTPVNPLPPDEQLRREYEAGASVQDLVYRHHAKNTRIRQALWRAGTVWRTQEQSRRLQVERSLAARNEARAAREERGHGRPPAKASSRSAGSTPAVAPALELEERQAMVTEFRMELSPELTLAAVTVSAMSIVADAFGDVLGIGAADRSEIATMRDRLEGGDRGVKVIGSPALNRVALALKQRHPDAYRRLTLLCERVA